MGAYVVDGIMYVPCNRLDLNSLVSSGVIYASSITCAMKGTMGEWHICAHFWGHVGWCRFITCAYTCGGWLVSSVIYTTDLPFSPRAPVRLSVCVKHALGGQTYPLDH